MNTAAQVRRSLYPWAMALLVLVAIYLVLVALPGIRSLTNPVVTVAASLTSTLSYAKTEAEVAALVAGAQGYDLQMPVPGTYLMSYRRAPGWALVVGVLTFPLGIFVILLGRETLMLTIFVADGTEGTRVTMIGRVDTKVAEAVGAALRRRLLVTAGAAAA